MTSLSKNMLIKKIKILTIDQIIKRNLFHQLKHLKIESIDHDAPCTNQQSMEVRYYLFIHLFTLQIGMSICVINK